MAPHDLVQRMSTLFRCAFAFRTSTRCDIKGGNGQATSAGEASAGTSGGLPGSVGGRSSAGPPTARVAS